MRVADIIQVANDVELRIPMRGYEKAIRLETSSKKFVTHPHEGL